MTLSLRRARPEESARLTEIAFAAKAHWGYPPEWLELWRDELTITEASFAAWDITGAVVDEAIVGFCSVGGAELENLWVAPTWMGRGVGTRLLEHAAAVARSRGAAELRIVADPHAEAFYQARGARRVGTVPSRPEGRVLPCLVLPLR